MTKTRQSALLAAVAVLVVAVAGWYLLISPESSHAASLRAQAAQASQQAQTLHTQIAMQQAQERQLPAKQALLAQLENRIPSNPALPSMIRQLSAAATSAGVVLVSMSPSQPTVVPTTAPAPVPSTAKKGSSAAPAAPAAPALDQISVQLSVVGAYFNLEQFFANLENLPRALRVTGFSMTASGTSASTAQSKGTVPAPVAPGTAGPGQETASITALVFMAPTSAATAAS